MKYLTERQKQMLLNGARITGSFVESVEYNFEDWYTDEYEDIKKFAEWIENEVGGAGRANIDNLYLAFKNPNSRLLQNFKNGVKEKIAALKKRMNENTGA